jgi:diacylglycerol kinase (ATP)
LEKLKAALVVNPASGNGTTGKRFPAMMDIIKQEVLSFVHRFTESPGHATAITRQYLKEGHDLIIAVGGDGTTNEVVNGFFDQSGSAIRPGAAISFISGGTGRDLIRTVGIPADTAAAVKHIINSKVRPVDLGRVTFFNQEGAQKSRFYMNVAGLGLDGATVDRVNHTSKALGGFVSFLWATIATLALYKNQKMQIIVDDQEICNEPVTVVVLGNGRYFGGGMCIAPNACIDDGLLDIVILRDLSKLNLLFSLPRVYRGSHLTHSRITSLRGKKVRVIADQNVLLDLDGEQPGCAPIELEILPCSINLRG